MILFFLDAAGGFTCGDTVAGVAEYAYPSSIYATLAKREPAIAARAMIAKAMARASLPESLRPSVAARDSAWLAMLAREGVAAD